jgi:signal transduction histidine kinase
MLRQTARLEHLVDDMLDASQMEAGVPAIRREEVDPAGLIAEAVAESDPGLASRIVFDVAPTPPVLADGLRVKQVVLNLLSNAVKYSPTDGPIGVAAAARGGMCTISVTDAGAGIPPDEQARIFDRFYRVDNGSTRATGGVGLGLYIAKQLVESMGGRLWVRSEPGAGSTFSFSLPLVRPVEVDVVTPSAAVPASARG